MGTIAVGRREQLQLLGTEGTMMVDEQLQLVGGIRGGDQEIVVENKKLSRPITPITRPFLTTRLPEIAQIERDPQYEHAETRARPAQHLPPVLLVGSLERPTDKGHPQT